MKALRVWWEDREIGRLSPSPTGGLRFTYQDSWLESPSALPLSRSLPLNADPQPETAVHAFFAGLLPEERVRQRVAANLGLSASNDFALLEALGGDCAGAIRILRDEAITKPAPAPVALRPEDLANRLRSLPRTPLLAGEEGVRLSLAGAQSKLPLRRFGDQWFLSDADRPSTHILKPEPEDYPGLAAVEAFCLDLARSVGVPSVRAEVMDVDGLPVLSVERYDRDTDESGDTHRIHQEDLCQSLGLPPHRKYQQEGGPSAADAVTCIREWSTVPVLDLRQFVDLLMFNLLIGNADAHGKNLAWLYHDGARRLAPAYDLVATTLWPELSPRMAMRIGQAKFVEEVTLDHFLGFARNSGLGIPMVKERVRALAAAAAGQLEPALHRHPGLTIQHRETLHQGLRGRLKKLGIL